MIRMWLIDHGADWASRAADFISRPFHAVERYCNAAWWNDYTTAERTAYQRRFYPREP